jgi:aminoglycoside/choline kinase family phosphotransferase
MKRIDSVGKERDNSGDAIIEKPHSVEEAAPFWNCHPSMKTGVPVHRVIANDADKLLCVLEGT